MNHLIWPVSLVGTPGSGLWHGHVLFDCRPSGSQVGFAICRNPSHGICPYLR